jgi:hypothetical protein
MTAGGMRSTDLYKDWCQYAEDAGEEPGTQKSFGEAMSQRGYARKFDGAGLTLYVGVRLRAKDPERVCQQQALPSAVAMRSAGTGLRRT